MPSRTARARPPSSSRHDLAVRVSSPRRRGPRDRGGGVGGLTTAPAATAATCSSELGRQRRRRLRGARRRRPDLLHGGWGRAERLVIVHRRRLRPLLRAEPARVRLPDQPAPAPSVEACVNTPPEDAYWGLWWSDGNLRSLGLLQLRRRHTQGPRRRVRRVRLADRRQERAEHQPGPARQQPAARPDADRDATRWWRERWRRERRSRERRWPRLSHTDGQAVRQAVLQAVLQAVSQASGHRLRHADADRDRQPGTRHRRVPTRRATRPAPRPTPTPAPSDGALPRLPTRRARRPHLPTSASSHACGDPGRELRRGRGSTAGVGGPAGPPRAGRRRCDVPAAPASAGLAHSSPNFRRSRRACCIFQEGPGAIFRRGGLRRSW